MLSIRPAVAEHSLVVLSRSVHPELFQIHRTQTINRNAYRVRIDITNTGHNITFSTNKATVCEVVSAIQQELPQHRRLTNQRIGESNRFHGDCKDFISYETDVCIETASRQLFYQIQKEFGSNPDHELLQVFGASGRVAWGAVSYVHIDQRAKQLRVQAFHTFPDEYAILKSSSTFTVNC